MAYEEIVMKFERKNSEVKKNVLDFFLNENLSLFRLTDKQLQREKKRERGYFYPLFLLVCIVLSPNIRARIIMPPKSSKKVVTSSVSSLSSSSSKKNNNNNDDDVILPSSSVVPEGVEKSFKSGENDKVDDDETKKATTFETHSHATTNRLLELEELTTAQKVKLRAAVKKGKSIEEERNALKEKLEEEIRVSEETRKTSDILIEQLREQVKKMDGKVKVLEAMKEATTSSNDNNDLTKKEEKVLKEKNEQLEAKAKEQEVSIARLESEQKTQLKETDALQREKTRMSR